MADRPEGPPYRQGEGIGGARAVGGVFLVLFGVYAVLGLAMLLAKTDTVGPYGLTYWALDYELGFVKRALVGQVNEALFGAIANTERFIQIAAFCVAGVAILTYGALAALATARHRSTEAFGFVLLGLFGGQMVAQFGADLGRLDQIGFIAGGAGLLLMRGSLHALSLLVVGLLMVPAILAHEVALVAQAPLLLALAWTERRRRGRHGLAVAWLALPMLVAAVAVVARGAGELPPDVLCRHYAATTDFFTDCRVHGTLSESLAGSVAMTLAFVTDPANGYGGTSLLMLVILAAWSTLLIAVLRTVGEPRYWACALAANAPIALCLVGLDYYRWLHLVVMNGVVLLLYVAAGAAHDPFREAVRRFKVPVAAALCVVLAAAYFPGSAVEKPEPPAGLKDIFLR